MKVSELQGAALDWAVAKCEGYFDIHMASVDEYGVVNVFYFPTWQPSTDWTQGGPIIEREKIGVWWATHYVDDDGVEYGNHWYAEMGCTDENVDSRYCGVADGPTPLITAMRCYVASKLGDEIELPEELK
jgi:hypothetical protein